MNNLYDELDYRLGVLESSILDEDDSGVIKKVGNKWKILKKDKKSYWDAEYDTKEKAQAALKAYWANKHESLNESKSLVERYRESK